MSEHGKETVKKICEHVNAMTQEQRLRLLQMMDAISFLKEAKK